MNSLAVAGPGLETCTMDASDAVHPTDQTLQNYGLGKLDDHLFQKVSQHLEACAPCRERVSELSSDTFLGRLRHAQAPSKEPVGRPPQERGARRQPNPAATSGQPDPSSTLPAELVVNPDYEIIRELGRGGMGVVYLVRNRLMARHEAIKIIGRQLMDRPVVLDRFLREIRSVARLRHPNVVAAYSATRMSDSIVYAMEYVDGLDLARLVKSKGPLPVTHACYFTHQVALGLQHAHEQGIVHRDIKPGNLILSRTGERSIVKILDFGLTKAASEDGTDTSLTQQGQMLGTPDFIAPEQTLDAQSVDIRADIYSLGCTLYYLLSGRPPFRAGSLYEVLQAHHSTEATALYLLRPEVPVELASIVAKMMAKQAKQRYQTPADVADALTSFFKRGQAIAAIPQATTEVSVGARTSLHSRAITTLQAPKPKAIPEGSSTAPRTDSSWESLIELGEPGSLTDAAPSIAKSASTPRWLWPSLAATVSVLGLIAAFALGAFSSGKKETLAANKASQIEPARPDDRIVAKANRVTDSPKKIEPIGLTGAPNSTVADEVLESPKPLTTAADKVEHDATVAFNRARVKVPTSPVGPRLKGAGKTKAVDVRQIRAVTGIDRLPDTHAVRPAGSFWPSLAPAKLDNWQIGDPDHITMNEKGLHLEAGPNGNLLLTREGGYRKCVLTITLSAKEGTVAYLALHARRGPQGWRAVTARIHDEGGKIRVGHLAIDFQTAATGGARTEFSPGKLFGMRLEIDERNLARITVKGEKMSSPTPGRPQSDEDVGAVGVFVTSGTVVIERMDVQDQ
jgi:serine/threonine protein kinase